MEYLLLILTFLYSFMCLMWGILSVRMQMLFYPGICIERLFLIYFTNVLMVPICVPVAMFRLDYFMKKIKK